MLPLHYGRNLWFLKDLNPHRFIRSEKCYPLHQRTIVVGDGFEPPQSPSKGDVLPLDDPTIVGKERLKPISLDFLVQRKLTICATYPKATNMSKNLVRKQKARTFFGSGPLYSFLLILHSNSQTHIATLVPFLANGIKHIDCEVIKQSFHVLIIIPQRYKSFSYCLIF